VALHRSRRACPRVLALAAAIAVGALATGCSTTAPESAARGTAIHVAERDFAITVSAPERVPAGDVALFVENQGPDTHELFVVRSDGTDLPMRSDGSTVDEEALEPVIVGRHEGAQPGTGEQLQLHLTPGRYVMFCNMAGHYLGGMHADLVVQ
jgi:uncharacterized cupredoxin-like copper-binding protein